MEGTFSHISQFCKWDTLFNGTLLASRHGSAEIRDFIPEESRLLKVKLYKGFFSSFVSKPQLNSSFERVSQNMSVQPQCSP